MDSLSNSINLVKQYLDVRVASHAVHSANMANAETPGYKAKVPVFENALQNAGSANESWKLGLRVENSQGPGRLDGNNVQMEYEMTALADNSLKYMSGIQILNKEMALSRYAITNGR